MIKIQESFATEDLLKMYFFKLHELKPPNIIFIEEKLDPILRNKKISQINSKELFDCLKIERRGLGWNPFLEDFDEFIPSKFYFIDHMNNSNGTYFEHSFLYTNFKSLNRLNLYVAEIGLYGLGYDIINENGNILKSEFTNLYDYGASATIDVIPISKPLLLITDYDKNNGFWHAFYSFNNIHLIQIDELNDRSQVLELLKFNPIVTLQYASEELQNDKEIVLDAVTNNGDALGYASEELRNDKQIVLAAVTKAGRALQYASEELRNDKEIVLDAVTNNGDALEYASEDLRNDKEIVLAAVNVDGDALEYASEELRNDKQIVLAAVTKFGYALQYASEELRNDKEIVLASVTKFVYALEYASEELRNNKEIVLAVVTKAGGTLQYASEELRNDKEIVLAAVNDDGGALEYASEELQNDKQIVIAAEELRHDRQLKELDDDLPF